MRLRIYSVNLYRQLQAETGPSVGWHEVGSLRLASSRDHFKYLQRQIGQAKALGMEVEMISPTEALRIFPCHDRRRPLRRFIYPRRWPPRPQWCHPRTGATGQADGDQAAHRHTGNRS